MPLKWKIEEIFFYLTLGIVFFFILLTNPFLKIPYDVWEHLIRIASFHDEGKSFIFWPENRADSMYLWHWFWGMFFRIIHINDLFLWAKIIHTLQFSLAFFAVFYFSKTAIQIIKPDIKKILNYYFSLISVLLWFIGNGTYSVAYQQAWVMWYSVNYQGMTIPLFWYITALTLRLFYEENLPQEKAKLFFYQIIIFSITLIIIHPTEEIYYLIHLAILLGLNLKKTFALARRYHLSCVIFLFGIISLAILVGAAGIVPIPWVFQKFSISGLFQEVNSQGHAIAINGMNRFNSSFSKVAIFSIIIAVIIKITLSFRKKEIIEIPPFDYLLLSSAVFFLIPLNVTLAGIVSSFTHVEIVWRFFFASSWFVFIPITLSLLWEIIKDKVNFAVYYIASIFAIFGILAVLNLVWNDVCYQNGASILASLGRDGARKVGVQYSREDIANLKAIIDKSDTKVEGKPNIFYVRGDLAVIVRGVLRKYVYADRKNLFPKASFFEQELNRRYNLINIVVPSNFPKDTEIFAFFSLEKK